MPWTVRFKLKNGSTVTGEYNLDNPGKALLKMLQEHSGLSTGLVETIKIDNSQYDMFNLDDIKEKLA